MATTADQPQHTPGPYAINVARLSDNSINVAHVLGPKGQGLAQVGVYQSETETLANLALFSAGPELLEMTRLLERTLVYEIKKSERDGDDEGANLKFFTLVEVRNVIAKATGTS